MRFCLLENIPFGRAEVAYRLRGERHTRSGRHLFRNEAAQRTANFFKERNR